MCMVMLCCFINSHFHTVQSRMCADIRSVKFVHRIFILSHSLDLLCAGFQMAVPDVYRLRQLSAICFPPNYLLLGPLVLHTNP